MPKINKGDGTVSKLLNSRELHDKLVVSMGKLDGVLDKVNNGDGTITDTHSTLTWEVLVDDGSIHDWDDFSYQWAGAFGKT